MRYVPGDMSSYDFVWYGFPRLRTFARTRAAFSLFRHLDLDWSKNANLLTSIGMFVGDPPGPGAAEIRAAMGIGAFGSRYANNPVAQQKLLRLGEDTVCDRHAIFLTAHNLRFIRSGQALCGHKLSGFGQFFINAPEYCHMRLNILLRPGAIGVNACLRAGHQQNVFHSVRVVVTGSRAERGFSAVAVLVMFELRGFRGPGEFVATLPKSIPPPVVKSAGQ
jgi:hypothetical protein